MRFLIALMLLLSMSLVRALELVEVLGSGETGAIGYGETVTGAIEVSDAIRSRRLLMSIRR